MSDAIEDAMNLILPVLQAAHGTIIQKAGQLPLHPALLKAVRKLGGKLQLTIAYKDPLKGSYMQQIGWDISDPNEMCALAILAAPLLPSKPEQLVLLVHNDVGCVRLWTIDGKDELCVQTGEFATPLSAKAGK